MPSLSPDPRDVIDPATLVDEVADATTHLLDTVADFGDDDVRAPSPLPGWSRGHVLAHLAGNADGLRNLLVWAKTGVETPMYTSWEDRNAAVEKLASGTAAEHLTALRESNDRFLQTARELGGDEWDRPVAKLAGIPFPARRVLFYRWEEVLVHHVDLAVDYTPAHWPAEFTDPQIDVVAASIADADGAPAARIHPDTRDEPIALGPAGSGVVEIRGPEPALLAWMIGRTGGDGLAVEPHGPLPPLPGWKS